MACEKCDNGYITIEPLGMKVKCTCMIESPVKYNKDEPPKKPVYSVTNAQKEMATYLKLIPESRQDDEYDAEIIKANVTEMCSVQKCKVRKFDEYINTLNSIIVSISTTGKLRQSYIIGAPNSFGKTTFAYTCIKRLYAMGKKVVPYLSLYELAELKAEYERKVYKYIKKSRKEVNEESKNEVDSSEDESSSDIIYTWEDFMKSDVLFTYLTTLDNMKIEVSLLKTIMDIRGPKELPTVVFTTNPLKPYFADEVLKTYYWDEILAYNEKKTSCDRLIHKSCYKVYKDNDHWIQQEDE